MYQKFRGLPDEDWLHKIAGTGGQPLFDLPEESLQVSTVGKSGLNALRDASMFYLFCRKMLVEHGNGVSDGTTVMDFGCAWGRIIRFWMKDVPARNLLGVDVLEEYLNHARKNVPGPTYTVIDNRPPLPHGAQAFDLIYAFSVFSHLPEYLANTWIEEFTKVLKPGGIICITTRPRAHIEMAGTSSDTGAHSKMYADVLKRRDEALSEYDAGKFVFYGSGTKGKLGDDVYGEAIIPPSYIEAKWGKNLNVIGYFEKYSATYLQPCIVLRKPR